MAEPTEQQADTMGKQGEQENLVSNEDTQQQPSRFRVAVHVINALRRFGEAMNPTYTYGKRSQSHVQEEPINMHASQRMPPPERRSKSTFSSFMFPDHGSRMSFNQRGHKGHLAFAPLQSPYNDKLVSAS